MSSGVWEHDSGFDDTRVFFALGWDDQGDVVHGRRVDQAQA